MTEQPDDLAWDIDRDGRMRDYAGEPVTETIEPYDPEKDPVTKGLTDPDGRVE